MTRGPLEAIEQLRRNQTLQPALEPDFDDSTIPWTFNQILLPIILVLTFIILTEIGRYKQVNSRLTEAMREMSRETLNPKLKEQIAVINLQLQTLLRYLEVQKSHERIASGLAFLTNASLIERSGTTLKDDHFKNLCVWAQPLLDDGQYQTVALNIYGKILARAKVSDRSNPRQLERSQVFSAEELLTPDEVRGLDEDQYSRMMTAEQGMIAERNRKILHNSILEFLDGLKEEVKTLQLSVIKMMFEETIENPERETLSDANHELIEQMMKLETSQQEREMKTQELYRNILREWEIRYKKEGYALSVWKDLKL